MSEYGLVRKVNGYFEYLRNFVSKTGLSGEEVDQLKALNRSN